MWPCAQTQTGDVIINMRMANDQQQCGGTHCRFGAKSTDGGKSFSVATPIPSLVSSGCQGSLLFHPPPQAILFSNPRNTESLFPTLTVIIDLPPQIGLARLKSKDRLESQPIAFHERVRQEFLQLAAVDPERYFIVNGNQSIEDTHTAIISRVSQIPTLKRNAVEDKGNLLLRPIRAAGKAVKKTSDSATKAVKKTGTAVKSKAKPAAKKPAKR